MLIGTALDPKLLLATVLSATILLGSCGGGDGGTTPGGQGTAGANEQQLAAEIENMFPFMPDQPFEASYWAARLGSQLLYFWQFKADASLLVSITTDTHDDFTWAGSYTYANGVIRILVPDAPPVAGTGQLQLGGLFIGGLDESSTIVMPQFGLVAAFATDTFAFAIAGHGENAANPSLANYGCPIVNDTATSYEENAIEFGLTGRPFPQLIPGSVFRQRDVVIKLDPGNPRITRATGIYRTVGNVFYATFRVIADFAAFAQAAGVQLPIALNSNGPFPDFNLLKGEFGDGSSQVAIDQLGSAACDLR